MRVVVDTNVWASGLILPDSRPGAVLDAIRRREIVPVTSWALAEELADVLRRPRLRKYGLTERDVRDALQVLAPFLPDVDVEVDVPVPIRDPDDVSVVVAAIAGEADVIVTGDRDILDDDTLVSWLRDRNVSVLTPAELLRRLEG